MLWGGVMAMAWPFAPAESQKTQLRLGPVVFAHPALSPSFALS